METVLRNIGAVQDYLRHSKIDGWLIYDFFGLNKVANVLFEFHGKLVTRRWFYYIPSAGEPTLILHKIEITSFPQCPGQVKYYAGREELHKCLASTLAQAGRIAMEYSPENDIPTVSLVDAGSFEMVKKYVREIVSSANIVQYFTCRLSPEQIESHKLAAKVCHETQQQAFAYVESKLQAGATISEFDVQQFIMDRFRENDLVTHAEPIVGVNGNASNPHYAPSADNFSPIRKGDCLLIDLWAKQNKAGAVFADITWIGFAGQQPPEKYVEIWEVARAARDLAVNMLRENHEQGKVTRGYEIDEAVRGHITGKGYGPYFFHRTGHSIDQEDHGKGVNIDSFETRDSREIMPGLLFSIEPGIYLPEFGVRTEIDVFYGEHGPEVYTPAQTELVLLDV